MEGNFLSRYNNKMDGWNERIRNDPANKSKYEAEMAEYVMKCMPFMNEYTKEDVEKTNTDNIFNVKETTGLKRKDIFTEYLIEVENQNIQRPREHVALEICDTCGEDSNILHFHETADLVCDGCGQIVARAMSEELTYREEQETSEKVVNYSYKRENHFNEWLSQFQAQRNDHHTRRSHRTIESGTQENQNQET